MASSNGKSAILAADLYPLISFLHYIYVATSVTFPILVKANSSPTTCPTGNSSASPFTTKAYQKVGWLVDRKTRYMYWFSSVLSG